jgi:hypothetical protein
MSTAPAGDVERHGADVAHVDELDVGALLDDLAEDLVTEHQVRRCRGAAADHVLVAAADVGGDHLEDHAVVQLAPHVGRVHPRAVLEFQLRVVGLVYLDLAGLDVRNASVACHR